jgi:hypothetical protein
MPDAALPVRVKEPAIVIPPRKRKPPPDLATLARVRDALVRLSCRN